MPESAAVVLGVACTKLSRKSEVCAIKAKRAKGIGLYVIMLIQSARAVALCWTDQIGS